jgi:hypothetical protein
VDQVAAAADGETHGILPERIIRTGRYNFRQGIATLGVLFADRLRRIHEGWRTFETIRVTPSGVRQSIFPILTG